MQFRYEPIRLKVAGSKVNITEDIFQDYFWVYLEVFDGSEYLGKMTPKGQKVNVTTHDRAKYGQKAKTVDTHDGCPSSSV